MKLLALSLLFLFVLAIHDVAGQYVVNEVLANEPGSFTSLEWIELLNPSDTPLQFDGFNILVNGSSIVIPTDAVIAPRGYQLICRRLFANGTSPGFESVWGDSSGVWGDCEQETDIAQPIEASFSLPNSAGVIEVNHDGEAVSRFEWTESGADGVSWERVYPDSDRVAQCESADGSTPGRVNSVTPLKQDMALDSVEVRAHRDYIDLIVHLSSRGTEPVSGHYLFVSGVYIHDTIPLRTVEPLRRDSLYLRYSFPGIYVPLNLSLSEDDRLENNEWSGFATGTDFPPVVLSEIMPDPQAEPSSEWVEIFNASDTVIDIAEWSLGDAVRLSQISQIAYLLRPGEFVVLAQSKLALVARFPGQSARIIEVTPWPMLNNDVEVVRLMDRFGIEADRFGYKSAFSEDYPWSRRNETETWGRSAVRFGTPGSPNEVVPASTESELRVELSSKYISPDGDGFQDELGITVVGGDFGECTIRIFDSQGREVRTLARDQQYLPLPLIWDGLSDSGGRLPIGLYIVMVERSDGVSARTVVVVAR
ncbi:MAG TPA: lamin tail domain-containing protein [candidate division Zixibacteria bacterium]|nr:lamin tail domain-containing protein [candidate division Zixibacteria bacterium]